MIKLNYGRPMDRSLSFMIYIFLVIFVLKAGSAIINYSLDIHFYYYYLMEWDSCLTKASSMEKAFPELSSDNYVEYMDNLVKLLRINSISVPISNTEKPYIYKMNKTGFQENQNIFLLCFQDKIILYGLSKSTFNMLDKLIDQRDGNKAGDFKGQLQKDKIHYVGIWNL